MNLDPGTGAPMRAAPMHGAEQPENPTWQTRIEVAARQVWRAALAMVMLCLSASTVLAESPPLTPLADLGKQVFFDKTLSVTGTQSCASCHAPEVGFSGPNQEFNKQGAYEGAVHGAFGKRKPQTAAYVGAFPILHIEMQGGVATFVGGSFWDGRATGLRLQDPLPEQADGPLVNPVEQALPDSACVVARIGAAPYASLYRRLNPGICESPGLTSPGCQLGRSVSVDPKGRPLDRGRVRRDGTCGRRL